MPLPCPRAGRPLEIADAPLFTPTAPAPAPAGVSSALSGCSTGEPQPPPCLPHWAGRQTGRPAPGACCEDSASVQTGSASPCSPVASPQNHSEGPAHAARAPPCPVGQLECDFLLPQRPSHDFTSTVPGRILSPRQKRTDTETGATPTQLGRHLAHNLRALYTRTGETERQLLLSPARKPEDTVVTCFLEGMRNSERRLCRALTEKQQDSQPRPPPGALTVVEVPNSPGTCTAP